MVRKSEHAQAVARRLEMATWPRPLLALGLAVVTTSRAITLALRPLNVLRTPCAASGEGLRGAGRASRARTRSRPWPRTSTPWPSGWPSSSRARWARSSRPARPPMPPSRAFPIRSSSSTPPAASWPPTRRRGPSCAFRADEQAARLGDVDPAPRAAIERARAPRAGRPRPLRVPGIRGGRAPARRRRGAPVPASRQRALRRGRRHHRRGGDPAGRDAPPPLRRAQDRSRGHRGPRVPDAAHVVAHGRPPLPGGSGGPAHAEAGRAAARRARGLRADAGDGGRPARPLPHRGRDAGRAAAAHRGRDPPGDRRWRPSGGRRGGGGGAAQGGAAGPAARRRRPRAHPSRAREPRLECDPPHPEGRRRRARSPSRGRTATSRCA